MNIGDMVAAADKTAYITLWEGTGILVRPDEGRTYAEWSASWEVLCDDGLIRVIDGGEIEVINASR